MDCFEIDTTERQTVTIRFLAPEGDGQTYEMMPVSALALAGALVATFLTFAGPQSAVRSLGAMPLGDFLEMMAEPNPQAET